MPSREKEFLEAKERRIVLLGKTGKGKSATGNSILGTKAFESKCDGATVTEKCQKETGSRFDLDITVVDTPGLFDTKKQFVDNAREIFKCINLATPGPHAFVIVLDTSRFTEEENEAIMLLKAIFKKSFLKYTIVLITHADDMEHDAVTPATFITRNEKLQDLIADCQNRYIAFNNRAKGTHNNDQVHKLLNMIDQMTKCGKEFCKTKEWEIHEQVLREKADMFNNRDNRLQQCQKFLELVEEETAKKKRGRILVAAAVGGAVGAAVGVAVGGPVLGAIAGKAAVTAAAKTVIPAVITALA